jgi:hypothetical protein
VSERGGVLCGVEDCVRLRGHAGPHSCGEPSPGNVGERCVLELDRDHVGPHSLEARDAPGTPATPERGVKHDAGKPEWHLFPWDGAEPVVRVLERGARKYAPDNWRRVPGWRHRYLDAAVRHLAADALGERADPETGLPHLAHATCCLLFVLALDAKKETP